MVPSDLISVTEMCEILPGRRAGKRLNLSTAHRWIRSGKIRSWRVGGGHLCVSRADVLRLLQPVEPDPVIGQHEIQVPPDVIKRRLREMGVNV